MAAFEVEEVLDATKGTLIVRGRRKGRLLRVQTDSREIKAGDLFLALKGEKFDGHEFVRKACQLGARGVVVEEARAWEMLRQTRQVGSDPVMVVGVKDTLRAYQDLARFHRLRFSIPVVAITGSNGKTTTKEMVYRVLATRWRVHKTQGNFNNAIGVPRTLLGLHAGHQAAVIEMGVDQVGQTTQLCDMARPTSGVITNVGPDHLEFYGTLARSATSKGELLDWLPGDGGAAILNADDRYFEKFSRKAKCPVISFGLSAQADVRAADQTWNGWRTEFRLLLPNRRKAKRVSVRTMGSHNIANALAGAAVGCAMGFSGEEIISGLEKFRPAPMRSEIRRWDGVMYLYDCYNANPASVKAALELLVGLDPARRTIAVLGDMLELGPKEAQFHQEVGREAAKHQVTHLIACGVYGHKMQEGVQKARGTTLVSVAKDAVEAGELLKTIVKRGDVVLIKASRGAKMERVLDAVRPAS
ncbi:MAG: UDP-N-acetylmuramoyl-tripeptide--D-alanyl-D-alanine ligase [Nitrospirota bacterium]|nr:UDP-N-acetylmuramoyl-tripeptide--D-alanyl-D-alanine ligase [Nitrospirota bacterium]MDH4359426.1 UDP-N-acetylmuramoyl-tripeptide--D-alanyl-D-alanine ligase [Nitrospirota bacterium]MDH5574805.1 UDP-N-acetylmuramoyl-tripeptide--D-alanyl-D-alanine ligase [Nitrospirota bacterium]